MRAAKVAEKGGDAHKRQLQVAFRHPFPFSLGASARIARLVVRMVELCLDWTAI